MPIITIMIRAATYRYHTEMREWGSTAARHEGNALPTSAAADSEPMMRCTETKLSLNNAARVVSAKVLPSKA